LANLQPLGKRRNDAVVNSPLAFARCCTGFIYCVLHRADIQQTFKKGKEDSFRRLTLIFSVNHSVNMAETHMESVLSVFGTVEK
jgi:hypothetical protein